MLMLYYPYKKKAVSLSTVDVCHMGDLEVFPS